MNRLDDIYYELEEIARREAIKVWRIARRAEKHGCSTQLVSDIRNEGFTLHTEMRDYPGRLLDPFRTWIVAFK